ncbi:MAG TPA: transketolase [Gammaproteobacteria bacterium]|nr:transketolase [Gammaproteobacteria bacterium]
MSKSAPLTASNDGKVSRREMANAIRALSMDAVQTANSGHPGAPMGMADIAEVLWSDFLRHNPANPNWTNRDRFVLSNGHGSMLLYALLHLSGYDLSIEELKQFRQLNSTTAGHPEYAHTPGVETTTGPLGQGLANAIGMAIAERSLAAEFNRDGFAIVDHHTYACVGDGCLMEGISHEACSIAGTLGLGKLIVIYDDNQISIDGAVEGWFTDDTAARFSAYGWQVINDIDGHDPSMIGAALKAARNDCSRPSIICCRTIIGYGAPNKQGTAASHGAALGVDEVAAARAALNWPHPPFEIPEPIANAWNAIEEGAHAEKEWQGLMAQYRELHPDLEAQFERRIRGDLPSAWCDRATACVTELQTDSGSKRATRKASQLVLENIGPTLPELIGGSSDLSESNNTNWSGSKPITHASGAGNYINYGVREFAMSAIMNGIALHGGFIPYGGTFLVFSDYARNAVRMSALMGIGVIYIYTHDSIGLGEDGPTHQPIEQAASLRLIPGLSLWRPCDGAETAAAWCAAIERRNGPTCLLLTRQGLPSQKRNKKQLTAIARGAYILLEPEKMPEAIIIATGSEVELAMSVAQALNAKGSSIRVISMPSVDTFERQGNEYTEEILPRAIRRRIAIEAGSRDNWFKYVGLDGCVIGLDSFGASAPAADLYQHFKLTNKHVQQKVATYLKDTAD